MTIAINIFPQNSDSGGGGSGTIASITSSDGSIDVSNGTGPNTDIIVDDAQSNLKNKVKVTNGGTNQYLALNQDYYIDVDPTTGIIDIVLPLKSLIDANKKRAIVIEKINATGYQVVIHTSGIDVFAFNGNLLGPSFTLSQNFAPYTFTGDNNTAEPWAISI